MQNNPPSPPIPGAAVAEPEVKFITPKNDLFYSAGLYRPLQTQRQEIRLLRILPGLLSAQLQCELVDNVFLSEGAQEYQALSYCAGDAMVVETIKVQNVDFNVFSNLGAGLRKIRKTDEALSVWVDQTCINQKDVNEREQQVLMMRSIYASASKTILWLGEENEGHAKGLAVSFLHTLCERARTTQVTHSSNYSLVFSEELIPQQGAQLFGEVKNGKYNEEVAALAPMYEVPWWSRCWVFQEAIVSKAADVVYGSSIIDFEAMRVANSILIFAYRSLFDSVLSGSLGEEWRQTTDVLYMLSYNGINRLVGLKEKWKTRPNLGIREVLNVSRQKDSTDPKDRVYAMLGLMDPSYNIKPNYAPSSTAAEAFIAATKAAIQHDGVLDILADGHEVGRNQSLGLPSWVPDFSKAPGHFPMCNWELDLADGKSLFNATLSGFRDERLLLSGIPPPEFLPDKEGRTDRVLHCAMLDLGPVALEHTIGGVPNISGSGSKDTGLEYCVEMLAAAGLKDIYPGTVSEDTNNTGAVLDEDLKRAFFQTLGCGTNPGNAHCGDRNIGIGDAATRKMHFLDRYLEVVQLGPWRFFVTPSKIMGVAPAAARWDDTLCLLPGATVPFVLRQISVEGGGENDYTLIGPAYLHGYMSGQAILQIHKGEREVKGGLINIH